VYLKLRIWRRSAVIAVALGMFAAGVFAQQPRGVIRGVVKDELVFRQFSESVE